MEHITWTLRALEVELQLTPKNNGKFRWKKRLDNSKFGLTYATARIAADEQSYLEWQIGYDAEINHQTKTTILNNLIFTGANNKRKNPYELSEILYLMIEVCLVTRDEIINLKNEISNRNYSFEESFSISTSNANNTTISDFNLKHYDINLPTFSYYNNDRSPSIEISIKQQQYASGVQPMVYFCLPINNFINKEELLGNVSRNMNSANFVINANNKDLILNLFKFFGMCSANHKHDVTEILNVLLNNE